LSRTKKVRLPSLDFSSLGIRRPNGNWKILSLLLLFAGWESAGN
jgi:hypothetical protein